MNAAFRHLSVRLWLTAIVGGLSGIFFLPWWQKVLGVEWMAIPAVGMMAASFAGAGWLMSRIGLGFLDRHVKEAARWERAGMIAEAEATFHKAMATFDSFWLSPLLRRNKQRWFSGIMARFYLGRQSKSEWVRNFIAAHLNQYADDEAVAQPWLEQLLAYESHLPLEHEAVACVSEGLSEHLQMQRLVMQFYIANGRIDFDAMQTYRRVWTVQQPLDEDTLFGLSRLLRNESVLNHWALQVYLMAYERGDRRAVEGIAAAIQWLPVTEDSRATLNRAEKIMANVKNQAPANHEQRYREANALLSTQQTDGLGTKSRPFVKQPSTHLLAKRLNKIRSTIERSLQWISARSMQRTVLGIVLLIVSVLGAMAAWHFYNRAAPHPQPQVQVAVEEQKEIADPFTIQVAAYLKSEDAQHYVQQLISNKLDAFWTQEKSANRTWYQVKVSHFADRQAAQRYGEELKSKGIIDDFYVANYEHARRHDRK